MNEYNGIIEGGGSVLYDNYKTSCSLLAIVYTKLHRNYHVTTDKQLDGQTPDIVIPIY